MLFRVHSVTAAGTETFGFRAFAFSLVFNGLFLSCLAAENLVPGGDFEDEYLAKQWAPSHQAGQTLEESHSGNASFRFNHCIWATPSESIEIDPQKSYVLRAFIKEPREKLTPEYRPLTVFIGLRLFNDQGEEIHPLSVRAVPNTQAVLARPASEGDQVLYLEGSQWDETPKDASVIVFGAEEDFSDLPNRDFVSVSKISAGAKGFEIHLSAPLGKSYPEGTRVRQHLYADFPVITVEPSQDWEEHSLEMGGVSELGAVEKGRFWPGTRYVRPTIGVRVRDAASMASEDPVELLVDDVSFTQTD